MAGTAVAGLSRVTIVAPRSRVDLAIPADVPFAHMLPTLLRFAGNDLADTGAAEGGWVLSRLGGVVLDIGRTPAQLDVRDGEVLYLTTRGNTPPELAFDDVADAMATATLGRGGRWTLSTTRRASLTIASAALIGGAAAVLFVGPPDIIGGVAGLAIGAILVITAIILSRALRAERAGVLFSLVALAYAFVGGLLMLGGDRGFTELGAANVLIGSTAVVVFSAVLTMATGGSTPLLLGTTASGVIVAAGAAACTVLGTSAAGAAAVIAAVTLVVVPGLPMLATRIARVPVPAIPTGPDDLKADEEVIHGPSLRRQTDRADGVLTSLVGACAAVFLGCEIVLAIDGGTPPTIFCFVLGIVLLLRARPYLGRAQRVPMIAAGSGGLGLAMLGLFLGSGPLVRLTAVFGGLLVIAITALVYGLGVAGKRIAPIWGRTLDIFEIILIVATIPLAAWVVGLDAWARALHA